MLINHIERLDYFLIDRVHQPVVNQASKHCGLSFISLAEFCLTGALLGWLGSILANAFQMKPLWTSIPLNILVLAGGGAMGWFMYLAVRQVRQSYRAGALNPARWQLMVMRIGAVLCAPIWFFPDIGMFDNTFHFIRFFGGTLYAVLNIAGYYFLSCQEGPPKKQKQRQATPKLAIEQGAT